jgi:hypothetical protein
MTIDERLEALTQTVELLASQHGELERSVNKLANFAGQIAEGTARLLHTAQLHQTAIESHETRLRKLED